MDKLEIHALDQTASKQYLTNMDRIHDLKKEHVKKCVDIVRNNRDVKRMIVFGSSVTDRCDEESDLDLCLDITCDGMNLNLHHTAADIGAVCEGACDILIYQWVNGRLKSEIDRKGVTVYELS